MKKLIVFLAGLVLIAGCATAGPKITAKTPIQDLNPPEWVLKGSGAFEGERGKVFYGVGVSSYSDVSIKRTSADNAARAELAKVFRSYIALLEKDYISETVAGERVAAEKHFEGVRKVLVALTLTGVQIVDHWQHPGNGALYALARLDFDSFKNNIEKVKNLNEKVREYVKQNAENLFDELSKEEKKMENR